MGWGGGPAIGYEVFHAELVLYQGEGLEHIADRFIEIIEFKIHVACESVKSRYQRILFGKFLQDYILKTVPVNIPGC